MKIVKYKANLIPYYPIKNGFQFYLSLRSKGAKQYPDYWSFWGGGIEKNETPEQAMIREIKEELNWTPTNYKFLGVYIDPMPNKKSIYFIKVSHDFEKNIEIKESQGGKFFTINEIEKEKLIIPEDKKPLFDLHKHLS